MQNVSRCSFPGSGKRFLSTHITGIEDALLASPSPSSNFTHRLGIVLCAIELRKGMYYRLVSKHKKNTLLKDLKISLWAFPTRTGQSPADTRARTTLALALSTGFPLFCVDVSLSPTAHFFHILTYLKSRCAL